MNSATTPCDERCDMTLRRGGCLSQNLATDNATRRCDAQASLASHSRHGPGQLGQLVKPSPAQLPNHKASLYLLRLTLCRSPPLDSLGPGDRGQGTWILPILSIYINLRKFTSILTLLHVQHSRDVFFPGKKAPAACCLSHKKGSHSQYSHSQYSNSQYSHSQCSNSQY